MKVCCLRLRGFHKAGKLIFSEVYLEVVLNFVNKDLNMAAIYFAHLEFEMPENKEKNIYRTPP